MAEQEQDQDRSEEPTPFKLRKAREKGQVARGADLGFVGSLLAFTAFVLWFGASFVAQLTEIMRNSLTSGIVRAGESGEVLAIVSAVAWPSFQPLVLLGGIVVAVLVTLELIQLRGFIFTTAPLKPDFKRLDPIKGLKRLFSMRLVKETIKNLLKMIVYIGLAWLMITWAVETFADTLGSASALVAAMDSASKRMLFAFVCAAIFFMFVDQIISRGEFRKQMRMSHREVTREAKEREGEPRFKQKRKELHKELQRQSEGLANLEGSDFLITNPEHYAIALKYDAGTMRAPEIAARGRNHFAQLLKRKARILGIPIVVDPTLARALFVDCQQGQVLAPQHFRAVAKYYSKRRLQEESPEVSETRHG